MTNHDPIAYTYEADHHCPACTEERFGRGANGFIASESTDSEGNAVGAVFGWDEWLQLDGSCETLNCGDCFAELATAHNDPCSENCPEYEPEEDEEPDTCLAPDGHWYVVTYGRARWQIHAKDCSTCLEGGEER